MSNQIDRAEQSASAVIGQKMAWSCLSVTPGCQAKGVHVSGEVGKARIQPHSQP